MVYSSQMVGRKIRQHILTSPMQIKGIIAFQFADRDMKVSNERGITERKKGSGGNIKTLGITV